MAHQIQLETGKGGLILVVGGHGTGDVGQHLLAHVVDALHEVNHVVAVDTVHRADAVVKVVADGSVVDLVLGLVGDGDQSHHVGILAQNLTQGLNEALGVVVGHGAVAQHTADDVPALHTVVVGGGGGVEVDVPHHGHTDLTAHIQQTADVLLVHGINADNVAVGVVHNALAVNGAAPGHHIVTHGLEVINLTIDLVGAVIIQLNTSPIGAVILGHHLVATEVVAALAGVNPRIPHAIQQTIALDDLLQQGLALGPGEVTSHLGKHGGGDGASHHHYGAQQRQNFTACFFHFTVAPFVNAFVGFTDTISITHLFGFGYHFL